MPTALVKDIPNHYFHTIYLLKPKIKALFNVEVSELNNSKLSFTLHLQTKDKQKTDIRKALDFVQALMQPEVKQNFKYGIDAGDILGSSFWCECLERRHGVSITNRSPDFALCIAGSAINVNQTLSDIKKFIDVSKDTKSKSGKRCPLMENSLNKQLMTSIKHKNKILEIRHPNISFKKILNYPFAAKEILLNWLSEPVTSQPEEPNNDESVIVIEPENSVVVIDEESIIFIDKEEGDTNYNIIDLDSRAHPSNLNVIDLTSEEDSISDPEPVINLLNKDRNNPDISEPIICLTPKQNISQNKSKKRKKNFGNNRQNAKALKMTNSCSDLVISITPGENCQAKNIILKEPEPNAPCSLKAPFPNGKSKHSRFNSFPSRNFNKRWANKTAPLPTVLGYKWQPPKAASPEGVEIVETNLHPNPSTSTGISGPSLSSLPIHRLRPIVIDGSNVARAHGQAKGEFSCKGIELCIQYFLNRGHTDITVFVPQYMRTKKPPIPIKDQHILTVLERKNYIAFTPSRVVDKALISSYDDRYIVELATKNGGVIVSNDNFRDLMQEKPEWKKTIKERLLMFCMVGDFFMPPEDPLGRNGPKLSQFLEFPA